MSAIDRARSAAAAAEGLVHARDAARADLATSVAALTDSWLSAGRVTTELRNSLNFQRETVESYRRMFLAGKRSWLDLLNVTRELATIERDLGDAEVQLALTAYRLKVETGGVEW